MIWYWENRGYLSCSLNAFYRALSTSKQCIHQLIDRRMRRLELSHYLFKIVAEIRLDHPTMCLRYMYYMINPEWIGRDGFEALLKENGFMLERRRRRVFTTDSSGVYRFENLLKDLELTGINQAFSSDITYYELNGRFYYITFILDCYSRRILGYSVSDGLTTEETTFPALKMACKTRGILMPDGIILHSDGGGQYYDKEFVAFTKLKKMINSMCTYPWENDKAERINGTIKNNYLIPWGPKTYQELQEKVDRAVVLYNNEKPHKSLKNLTPMEFEKRICKLQEQTSPTMTKSLKAKPKNYGAFGPMTLANKPSESKCIVSNIDNI